MERQREREKKKNKNIKERIFNEVVKKKKKRMFRGCLVSDFKPLFSVFKQHFTYFNALFYPHVFP